MEDTKKEKKVLLHACCAPCAAPSAERLIGEGFKPLLFYSNPNIAPRQEWQRRLDSLNILARALSLKLVVEPWDHQSWLNLVSGHEQDPEGGDRCTICFSRSLEAASGKAQELDIPCFTTSLTLSPWKDADRIFRLGSAYPGFLPRDFKKQNGVARSVALSRELALYRQRYCGCEFSLRSDNP